MLKHPTLDGLQTLKLTGMAAALADQTATPDIDELAFEERLGLLVDREITERENRRLTSRLRRARLRHAAALEDIDYRNPRGLDKGLIQSLASCQWAKEHLNILITGPTGVGKTWLACDPGTQGLPGSLYGAVLAPNPAVARPDDCQG
jgi:DNA replication protein DnaC